MASDASPATVRQAYVRRARTLHPDANSDRSSSEAERREADLRRVNDAWQMLKDPARRRSYDLTLESPPARARIDDSDPAPEDEDDFEGEDDDGILVSPGVAMLLRVGPALLFGAVMLGLLIITAIAGGNRGEGDTDTPHRCVQVDSDSAVSAECDSANGRIVSEVNRADRCPEASLVFASDRAGVLWCVEMTS